MGVSQLSTTFEVLPSFVQAFYYIILNEIWEQQKRSLKKAKSFSPLPQKAVYFKDPSTLSFFFLKKPYLFNNSGKARTSRSYSIFDVPANRLEIVSFQLAPLLQTKDWQTHWERDRHMALLLSTLLLFDDGSLIRASHCFPCLVPASSFAILYLPLFPLYRLTLDQVILSSSKIRRRILFQPLLISQANWLRCKPSQQGCDFDVTL